MGYKVEIEMNDKKLKKSMEYANKEKIQYVIVLGQDEINNKCFKIKDMFNNTEKIIYKIKDIKKVFK